MTIKTDITALVAALDIKQVIDFTGDFIDLDGDWYSNDEWREAMVGVLVDGVSDPDSGCPQSLEAMRAFFGVDALAPTIPAPEHHVHDENGMPTVASIRADLDRANRAWFAANRTCVRIDLLNAAWRANPDDPQLEGNALAMVNAISAMLDIVDAVSFDLVVGTLSDLGYVIQVGADASCIREIEDVLHEVLGLEQGDDGLWRMPACDGPDEGDAENGPPARIEWCCAAHAAFGGKAGC